MELPKLIEPGMKYFLDESLRNCNKNKKTYNNQFINISLLIGFILIVGWLLYYRKKNKVKIKEEQLLKEKQAKYNIIQTVKKVNEEQYREKGHLITKIPKFEENTYDGTINNLELKNKGMPNLFPKNENTEKNHNIIVPEQLDAINFTPL